MPRKEKFFSIKYKLLLVLIAVPTISLGVFSYFAINYFKRDKMAYVYESTTAIARSLSKQLDTELHYVKQNLSQILKYYNVNMSSFSPQVNRSLLAQDKIKSIIVFNKNLQTSKTTRKSISKVSGRINFLTDKSFISKIRQRLQITSHGLWYYKPLRMYVFAYNKDLNNNKLAIISLFKSKQLLKDFQNNSLVDLALFDSFNILTTFTNQKNIVDSINKLSSKIIKNRLPEGSFLDKNSDGEELIVSYSNVGLTGMKIASFVDGKSVLLAIKVLSGRTLLFFLIITSISGLISLIVSTKFTNSLRQLYDGISEVASGNLNVDFNINSNDEIGHLATAFTDMGKKLSALVKNEAESSRMSTELKTVKAVQDTLFPKKSGTIEGLQINSILMSSSECGGDWWHYYKSLDNKIHFCIGDVTGHGASAAIVTAAARSASSLIEQQGLKQPNDILIALNHAIYQTTKSTKMMTFFHGIIDPTSKSLTYSNASHEFPIIIKKSKPGSYTKESIEFILSDTCERLGEKPSINPTVSTLQLDSGDTIFLFTDGIIDFVKPNGKPLGEGGFRRMLVKAMNHSVDLKQQIIYIEHEVLRYEKTHRLADDITLLAVKIP